MNSLSSPHASSSLPSALRVVRGRSSLVDASSRAYNMHPRCGGGACVRNDEGKSSRLIVCTPIDPGTLIRISNPGASQQDCSSPEVGGSRPLAAVMGQAWCCAPRVLCWQDSLAEGKTRTCTTTLLSVPSDPPAARVELNTLFQASIDVVVVFPYMKYAQQFYI